MKRVWFALILMLLLAAGGIAITWQMDRIPSPMP